MIFVDPSYGILVDLPYGDTSEPIMPRLTKLHPTATPMLASLFVDWTGMQPDHEGPSVWWMERVCRRCPGGLDRRRSRRRRTAELP